MGNWIEKLTPSSALAKKMIMAVVLVGACFGAFCWGKKQSVVAQDNKNAPELGSPFSKDYNRRVVAFLHQNTQVTREELGEYLIARFGAERLEFLINRKIVEMECQKHNIFVTDAEVEQRFRQDLSSFGKIPLTEKDFVTNVLRRFNKTLYEWKEDVIRPKIMMEKLVKSQIRVTEQDVKEGFEARFGPKVECRMIVLQKGDIYVAQKVWENARKGRDQFLEEAKKQFITNLATEWGKVPPIHKHFGDKKIEETAFRLKENEISEPLSMPDGTQVILMCEKRLPADITVKYEKVWMDIHREVEELKVAQKIPETFAELRRNANPRLLLENAVTHTARVDTGVRGGLSAFDQQPSTITPRPQELPAPAPTKLLPPSGIAPAVLPNSPPPAPSNIVSPLTLPKFDSSPEKK